jgi:hypothetical protein
MISVAGGFFRVVDHEMHHGPFCRRKLQPELLNCGGKRRPIGRFGKASRVFDPEIESAGQARLFGW